MALLSIILFIIAIFLGFYKKINTGIVCYSFSLLLALYSDTPIKTVISEFNSDIFIMLLGTTYLFSIANENKSLELLAKKLLNLTGKRTYLLPFAIYGITMLLSSVGAGCLPSMTIMTLFAMTIAANSNISPLFIGFLCNEGADGGNLSPIATTGIVGNKLLENIGVYDASLSLYLVGVVSTFINVLVAYFLFKGYKCKATIELNTEKFNRNQILTLAGIFILALCVFILKTNVGLTAFSVAAVLLLLNVCNAEKAINLVPWNTLVMTTGVMMYISLMTKLGGIKLACDFVVSCMTSETVVPIMAISSGILSLVSSTTAVVMPTMIGMIPSIGENISVNSFEIASVATTSAHISGVSPLSSGGALILSAYVSIMKPAEEEIQKMFIMLFALAFGGIIFQAILGSTGFYKLFY